MKDSSTGQEMQGEGGTQEENRRGKERFSPPAEQQAGGGEFTLMDISQSGAAFNSLAAVEQRHTLELNWAGLAFTFIPNRPRISGKF